MSQEQKKPDEADPQDAGQAPTLWQVIKSVNASFFGVQSSANRKRDFTHGKPLPFIIVGLAMTAVFIGLVMLAVKLALRSAGM